MIIKLALELLSKPELASGAIECVLRLIFNTEVRKHVLTLIAVARIRVGRLHVLRRRATARILKLILQKDRALGCRGKHLRTRDQRRAAAPALATAELQRGRRFRARPWRKSKRARLNVQQRLK